MRIFAGDDLSTVLERQRAKLRNEIRSEDKNKLLNVNEADYIDYLTEKYLIDELQVYADRKTVSAAEELVGYQGKSYPKQVISYHLPFSGDS